MTVLASYRNQMDCANQLIGFYMRATLTFIGEGDIFLVTFSTSRA